MKRIRIRLTAFCFLCLGMMAGGCTHVVTQERSPGVVATTEAFKLFKGEYENTAYFKKVKPSSIAVLPFHYEGEHQLSLDFDAGDPADIVRRGMYNHIASLPFKDIEIFDTDNRLKNAGLKDVGAIDDLIAQNPEKLKSILGADAAVSGRVTHFDRIFLGIYSQVAVGCQVKMHDLKTGKLLWQAKHVTRAHAGGLSISPIGLAMATVASVWNLRQTEMYRQTDDLFREIISTIDLPETALALKTPKRLIFTTNMLKFFWDTPGAQLMVFVSLKEI